MGQWDDQNAERDHLGGQKHESECIANQWQTILSVSQTDSEKIICILNSHLDIDFNTEGVGGIGGAGMKARRKTTEMHRVYLSVRIERRRPDTSTSLPAPAR